MGVWAYIGKRMLQAVPTLVLISILVFIIIQLPPGDYVESFIAEQAAMGEPVSAEKAQQLRAEFGLDQPMWKRYLDWATGFVQGDFGYSLSRDLPVSEVLGERIWLTIVLNMAVIIFIWAVSFPIAIWSATHPYSWSDNALTLLGFIGLATPNFLLALVLLYLSNQWFGTSIGGLMAPEYQDQPLSWAKLGSILGHMWVPVAVIGTSGTAAMIRRLRANLMDELHKPYVTTARARGLSEGKLLVKYPLRVSLIPFIADIGNMLPQIISGAAIVSVVMSLPTTGPVLVEALQAQDMYLAGSFLMFLAMLTVFGMLISDILLAVLDPRIRLQGGSQR
ncbi:MAG: ABC transporter permease [Alphaproteobacteria bacterium]